jgi:hypothetical protein
MFGTVTVFWAADVADGAFVGDASATGVSAARVSPGRCALVVTSARVGAMRGAVVALGAAAGVAHAASKLRKIAAVVNRKILCTVFSCSL